MQRTRFAPSPTGLLHVGNAYSALRCQQWAEVHHGQLLLRIEDIDHTRCRPHFIDTLIDDLAWLGIRWQGAVRRQSEHLADYRQALERLRQMGVIYPCFCTRKQIEAEVERMGLAPHAGEEERYPGSCRELDEAQRGRLMELRPFAWRLDVGRALARIGAFPHWTDATGRQHPVRPERCGDMVVGRKDIHFSYHLAVVVDDALQGVTRVIRGVDLEPSTDLHRLLQALLDLPSPIYDHHPLLVGEDGERLAKRHNAPSLQALRQSGVAPERVARFLLHECGGVWPAGGIGGLIRAWH